jgi:alpha-L-rhamnosidase
MKQWVSYLGTRTDERGIVVREEPDGWCLGDWCTPDKVEIPEAFVNTCYYYHCADLLGKIARALNRNEDALLYNRLSEKIKNDFNKVYFNPNTNSYWENRQGANVFPLAFGIIPEGTKDAVFRSLLANLEKTNDHFDTGILATPLLIKVLSENNRTDLAYKLMNQRTEPGYGYLMNEENSCLWERWSGRSSRCHPMFGSVIAWFYNTLGGISPDTEKPGMKHIIIAPKPVDGLQFCKTSYRSVYGLIRSEWNRNEGEFRLEVDIPPNTTATVYLPDTENKTIYESGKTLAETKYIQHRKTHHGISMIEIGSGSYSFDIR